MRQTQQPHFQDILAQRISRRVVLGGAAALPFLNLNAGATTPPPRAPGFASVPATTADTVTVPEGYQFQVLAGWGDPLFEGQAAFDPDALTRAEQEKRFGMHNDMLALFPARFAFPHPRAQGRHLLCVNHEFFDLALMFPGAAKIADVTAAQWEAAYASMGVTVAQVEQKGGRWRVLREGKPKLNRRITPFTAVTFSGPAAQHRWIAAAAPAFNAAAQTPAGAVACGTLANCSGGLTPWGTYLSSEENFNNYIALSDPKSEALAAAAQDPAWVFDCGSFQSPLFSRVSAKAPAQFDAAKNPYAAALYGWVVEIDPYDPARTPRKRTALGRKKGECANTALTRDSRVAVYMGDDQLDEFVYKFVSTRKFDPAKPRADMDLLDDGALYAARFDENGEGAWIHMTVEAANRALEAAPFQTPFADEGDLYMRARAAARLLGATPMDRPEDVEPIVDDRWVGQGGVLIACTFNRNNEFARPGNPRRPPAEAGQPSQNFTGHILRIDEAGGDCAATQFRWDVFALPGDPQASDDLLATNIGAEARLSTRLDGKPMMLGARFTCPDNLCIDRGGNVWVSTDGSPDVFADCNDGIMVIPVGGESPRTAKRFLVGPIGSELTGPLVSPDQRAFLASIQHPGESDEKLVSYGSVRWGAAVPPKPFSSFPDGGWPRSAIVVVTRKDGGIVGS
ncbi:MAG: PhoX family phosphatase [Hyphomonadaceae bacterium]